MAIPQKATLPPVRMAPLLLFGHIKLSAPSNFTPLRSSIFTDTPEANTTGVLHMSTRQVQALAMVHPLSETMAARLNHRLSTKTHRRAPTLQPAKLRQQIAKATLAALLREHSVFGIASIRDRRDECSTACSILTS